jgi:hypothetical protein
MTTTICSLLEKTVASSSMMSRTEIQKERPEKENASHSLRRYLQRNPKSTLSFKIRSNLKMSSKDKDLRVLKKL